MKDKQQANIAIIDPSPLSRIGLEVTLTKSGYNVIASYSNGAQLLEHLFLEESLDILIVDINHPSDNIHLNVIDFAFIVTAVSQFPGTSIIVLTNDMTTISLRRAVTLKVKGYVIKSAPGVDEEILIAVDKIMKGGRYYSSSLIEELLDAIEEHADTQQSYASPRMIDVMEKLTERQIDVMRLLAKGYKNEDIAEELFIASRTVSAHKQNIIKTLELNDTSDLARVAVQLFK